MNRPQRKPSFGLPGSSRRTSSGIVKPSSGLPRLSSGMKGRTTPLLKSLKRVPLSAAKTNQRESYIGTAGHHSMKDPRPLSDKSYQKKCILEIIQVLGTLNYPNAVYPKMLNPPSNKDYQRIFEFLSVQLIGSYHIGATPNEAMYNVLKDLGYPFNISKSTLSNVGVPSSLPHALGAMTWIADLVKYSLGCEDAIEETLQINQRTKLKQEFCKQTYTEFMFGKDGPYDEIIDDLRQILDDLDADKIRKCEELQALSSKLAAEYDTKVREKERFSLLADDSTRKKADIDKIKLYLIQCDDYIGKMKEKTKEVELAIVKKKEEKETLQSDLFQLKSKISQQELGPADLQKLSLEKQHLGEKVALATRRVEMYEQQKWDLEVQFGKHVLQRDELVNHFNESFEKLLGALTYIKESLSSKVLESMRNENFKLNLGHNGITTNEDLLKNKIQPFFNSLIAGVLEVLGNAQSQQYQISKRINQDSEMLTDLKEKKSLFEQQRLKLINEENSLKEEFKKEEQVIKAEYGKVELTLQKAKIVQSESVEDIIAKANEAKTNTQELIKKCEKEVSEYKDYIRKLTAAVKQFQTQSRELLIRHSQALDDTDKAFREQLKETKAKVQEIGESVQKQIEE